MTTRLKLALRLAFSPDVRQRWRQVSVVVTSAFATLLVLLALGFVGAAQDSDAVIRDRSPVWASDPETAALQISLRGVNVDGEQYPVVWLNPGAGHEDDPAIVPPGLDHLPGPGEGVLSPGLVATGYDATDFGLLPSTAGAGPDGTIALDGVISLTDGWIYARPPEGRDLGSGGALLGFTGYDGDGDRGPLETVPDVPTAANARYLALWLLVGPALVLAIGGARSLSHLRAARCRSLFMLGLSTSSIRFLLAAETFALALPGSVAAVLCWLPLSHVDTLPLTGTVLRPDALVVSTPLVAVAAVAVVAVTAVAGAVTTPGRQPLRRRSVRVWQVLPLVLALAMTGGSALFLWGTRVQVLLLFGGLLALFTTLPLAMPTLVAWAGRLVARSHRPARWLAGRRLTSAPWNLARPASVVGLLVFLAGGAFALYDNSSQVEDEQQVTSDVTTFTLTWRDAARDDFEWLVQQLDPALVLPVRDGPPGQPWPVVTFASCQEAAPVADALGLPAACDGGALRSDFVALFTRQTSTVPEVARTDAADADADESVILDDAFVIDLSDGSPLSQREAMEATAGRLPAVNIDLTSRTVTVPIPVGWIVAGWALATAMLTVAIVREIGDRSLASLAADDRLVRLGLRESEIQATERWALLTPVMVSVPLGYLGAIAFAVMGYDLGYTSRSLGAITTVAAAALVLALATMTLTHALQRRMRALSG